LCSCSQVRVRQSPDRHIDIEVKGPDKVQVGQHYCGRGRVTNERDRGVGRALVHLDSRETRTGKSGGFKLCQRLYYAGTHTAFAYKGRDNAHAKIRLGGGAPQGAGDWELFELELYTSSCTKSPKGGLSRFKDRESGECRGYVRSSSPTFQGKPSEIRWAAAAGDSLSVEIEPIDGTRTVLSGIVSGPFLEDFVITRTQAGTPTLRAAPIWSSGIAPAARCG
jgi:hypothetical protein